MALPIPRPPPVTTATLPFKLMPEFLLIARRFFGFRISFDSTYLDAAAVSVSGFAALDSSRSSRRKYFPTPDLGNESRNSTWRGTLYEASRSRHHAIISSG